MNKKKEILKISPNNIWSNIEGLSFEEVKKKIRDNQNNVYYDKLNKTFFDIIFNNIFTLFNLLLLIITLIILKIKHYEQLLFLFVNSFNIFINIFQEIKAKKTLDKIDLLKLNYTKVIRENFIYKIPIENIVFEDILFLELGSQIFADSIIKKGIIEVNESLLTGESNPILKKEGDILYSGSYVTSGNACAYVFNVGEKTYISKLLKESKKYKKINTPLIKTFRLLVRIITFLLIPIVFILYFFYTKNLDSKNKDDFILGICGFNLGMMPSGLFLLTNITLFIGFIKLVKKKAYIKDLFGIEMLPYIDILCLDKTGTITDGTMSVVNIIKYPDYNLISEQFLSQIIDFFPDNNPTQHALYQKFVSSDSKKKKSNYKVLKTQSFSSVKKYSAIEFENLGTFLLGAPEFILKKQFFCIEKDFLHQARLGYRVLLLAQTDTPLSEINDNTNYKVISLISLEDNIKDDALETINYFVKNGIKIKIISGDNPETIFHIAKKLNIINKKDQAINLMNLDEKELEKISFKYNVFGRATPEQKKNIIQILKKNNHRIGMIGDGVNDILAFKEADISIAMASGNESSRNVANLVLIDSRFSSLTKVFSEGRRVINNLQKISVLFLVKNILFFLLAIVNIFFNLFYFLKEKNVFFPFPLKPLQFNLFDTFFIGIPSFFLSLENNNKQINKNFFKSIWKKVFLYPFLIVFFYSLLLLFFGFNDIQSISYYLTLFCSIVFFFLFIINCFPFNKRKIILSITMFLGFIISFRFL
ncbi:MAG: HAD-IC family P-type ATPase [Candidatus Phytoplasma stylosanthis]|uniref:HAD-IC family P-type ATPase n=1 Tax=Candidatus Phytoplasma stylosanthis TaxID=2798314 RepID=UPI00293AB701|nr:HAD-IC family P-type ATPase [Candidatus Phytoplasma stylosanthis]MDV3167783.1 HAD-IC family P-type ATPase [Candidatus Phytoplasma stylosanthis]MDV3170940.1 HAD-IC family P-type ATPase [Candidatus Phytoplasma stylosanthis]MDV3173688.1 HAD-IC family P-type ATPase [Candidatus Phytoplasma stylosanthis]MDV3174112.1 HAD-IC family P-type ATPase [Candidatus Phytoplasma stylosanthis]MDV3202368.1 HAD-IC family P-type ATPase [Candidatus Phytoplasma stylosanthis]